MNFCGEKQIPFLFAVNFSLTEGVFIENPLNQQEVLFQINGMGNKPSEKRTEKPTNLTVYPTDFESYEEKFNIIHKGLFRGDSFLTNLTVRTPIKTDLNLHDIFHLSTARYQLLVPDTFVCFSPERFVKIENGSISTNPMKGTIDANIPFAEDVILSDEKETAEHNTIVDLLRNDLSMVADNVRVEKFRYIDHIKTVQREILQVSSEIKGDLPENYQSFLGDIIFNMLPAGSISGAPKSSTIKLIKEAEKEDRGYYTGVFGYFDGCTLDSAVLIRFIEQNENELYFRSGGGITVNSKCENEYNEVLEKIYFPFV
ncbi:aminodeoxychorismate synthase component I [Paludibacteraceae bacterium OttesenSCG-928-F17]|nr:aminodeoxychorismate synthase component I [Paludibacteraceae bacterium OttesenSCG-928-F17]